MIRQCNTACVANYAEVSIRPIEEKEYFGETLISRVEGGGGGVCIDVSDFSKVTGALPSSPIDLSEIFASFV